MANVRGEEGSVSFDNGSGSVSAVVGTTAWTLDLTKDVLECTASAGRFLQRLRVTVVFHGYMNIQDPGTKTTGNKEHILRFPL